MKSYRRICYVVPCLGMLLASTSFSSVSYSQSEELPELLVQKNAVNALSGVSSDQIIIQKEEVVPGFNIPSAFLDDVSVIGAEANPTSQLGAENSYGRFEFGSGPEDLVLAVVTKQRRLSSGIFAVQNNGRYYLPLTVLSQIFGFYNDYDSSERYVEGWGVLEDDKYSIDARNQILRFRGQKIDLPSDAILSEDVADDDIYVSLDVLSQIWPMQMNVNLSSLTLKVIPDSQLPFELADQRRMARNRAMLSREERLEREMENDFPMVPYPYQLWSKPSVDLAGTFGFRSESDSTIGTVNVSGVNDLAYASADYSISAEQVDGSFKKPERLRFRLRRQNIHEGALPFGLEDTQLGDVNLKNRQLVSTSASGRGFIFSSEPYDKSGEFDVVTIEGVSVPGWEVELYLNNELINFSTVSPEGEYRFEDVSIGFGNNRFRVVLYGPQGQIRERVENYLYQSSMVEAGKSVFSGGVVDAGRELFSIEERFSGRAEGLTANLYAARGINSRLTGFASLNAVRDKDFGNEVSREYASAGVIGSLGSTIAQLEGYKQFDGGEAVDLRTLSDFFGFKVNAQISAFRDFESPDASSGTNAKKLETDFSVKRIFSTLIGALGLELRQNYLERESGTTSTRYVTRQSLGVRGVRTTNTTTTNISDGDHASTSGRLNVSTRYNRWNLRNTVGYSIHPDTELQNFQIDMRYGRRNDWTTGVTANYNFLNDEKRMGLQLSKDFQKYLGSLETSWSSRGGFGFLTRLSTSLGPYGETDDDYLFRSQPLQNVGAVQAFLYDDKDYDGVFTEGDEPIQDARIFMGRRATRERTNDQGVISEFLTANSNKLNVRVTEQSVENPYLIPSVPGYKIFPRAGVRQRLEFPMIETGAIDGTLEWTAGGKPIGGVRLQLLNDEGATIRETHTAVDGYYTFEQIPPGNYTIRPNPEDGLDIPFQYVDVEKDDLFKFGTNIVGASEENAPSYELGTKEIEGDGTLSMKNILSLAKGYKGKSNFRPAVQNNAEAPAKIQNASLNLTMPQNSLTKAAVTAVRIGDHADKVRIVMDLSAPIDYEINFDPQSGMIFVNMPYVAWDAKDKWVSKTADVISGYEVETTQNGIQMILSVKENIEVGAAGLLKASGAKNDRLFIDIEKK